MASKRKNVVQREPDTAASQEAFARVEAELGALPASEVKVPNADLQDAAVAGLAMVDIARHPDRLPRFQKLSPEEFPKGGIELLENTGLAAWYVQTKVLSESALSGGAKVDLAVLDGSSKLLDDLLTLVDYHVGHIGEVAIEVSDIRRGIGYHDRASDLVRAAVLVETWEDELRDDQRRYTPDAAARARGYADAIVNALRADAKAVAHWKEMRDRAWTLLNTRYRDVEVTGTWLFRREPEHASLFVPLRTMIGRIAPRRRRSASEGSETSEASGSPPVAVG